MNLTCKHTGTHNIDFKRASLATPVQALSMKQEKGPSATEKCPDNQEGAHNSLVSQSPGPSSPASRFLLCFNYRVSLDPVTLRRGTSAHGIAPTLDTGFPVLSPFLPAVPMSTNTSLPPGLEHQLQASF